ncbi:KEOPS complex subunit Pcc1 [Haladaptatus litoreus]|uniref:KEOPS complex subunit Pcc1 n=1 Tax=Haladaptatus litoreus TaxID=553468 RepID=A0A1N6UZU9_9EURY|nr:KEOPS complex subunit Pcc1 [Haladaptatus litoreus]SIQ71153.1 KEOPS complex subunit Pcc1 [Haladaptatus litoreus]
MSHDALFQFEYESDERALLIFRSVDQEIGEIDDDRSQTTVEREENCVVIRVSADDLVALRAAMNTWQTLVGVAERVSGLDESSPSIGR